MTREDKLKQYRMEMFEQWIKDTVDDWIYKYEAWDHLLGEGADEFHEEDWEWIKDNLKFDVVIKEKVSGE